MKSMSVRATFTGLQRKMLIEAATSFRQCDKDAFGKGAEWDSPEMAKTLDKNWKEILQKLKRKKK